MPARAELEICYFNLKPADTATEPNITSQGINAYAVPARGSNYTTTNPAQTASGISFRAGESEAWDPAFIIYWSSTSADATTAINKTFRIIFEPEVLGLIRTAGEEVADLKNSASSFATRAIRRVPV